MRIRAQLVCASFLLAGLVPALPGQTPSTPASTRPSAATPASAQTSISAPAETAAQPPKVTFSDGLLGIRAENSTLGDILKAVQSATGASIDSPGFASERVYVNLGPGEPRDILASLLNGSRYDYILLGSQQQPNSVARVMLTVRQTSHEQPAVSSTATVPATPLVPHNFSRPGARPNSDESDTSDSTPDREPPITPSQPAQPVPGVGTEHRGCGAAACATAKWAVAVRAANKWAAGKDAGAAVARFATIAAAATTTTPITTTTSAAE